MDQSLHGVFDALRSKRWLVSLQHLRHPPYGAHTLRRLTWLRRLVGG